MSNRRLVITDSQKSRLEKLASDSIDKELALRAQAVLARSEGKTIMEASSQLNVNKDFISRWEKRFQEGGIDALYSRHGGGRVSPVSDPDLDQKILNAIETRKGTQWSKQELADQLGIKVAKLDHELSKMNITTMRNTSWEFGIKNTLFSRSLCPAGLYLSGSARCLVFCSSNAGLLSGGEERFTTRNRLLAEELDSESGDLTLRDALWTASDHASDKPKKNPPQLTEFLLNLEQTLPKDNDVLCIAITQTDSPISYRGKRPERLVFHTADTIEDWLSQTKSALLQMTPPDDQKAPGLLAEAIEHYINASKPETEPIIWTKAVSLAVPVIESSAPVRQQESRHNPVIGSIEADVLKALDQDRPLQNKELRCAMIPVILDSEGLHYSVVTSEQKFPDADAFGFSSGNAFMKGFNQMEQPMLDLRNKTGEQCTKMFVEAVKKKNTTAE